MGRKALALILIGALLTPLAASADVSTLDQDSTSAFVGQLDRYLHTAIAKEAAEQHGAAAFLKRIGSRCGKSLPGLPPKPPKAVTRTYQELNGEATLLLVLAVERPLQRSAAAFSSSILRLRWQNVVIHNALAADARQQEAVFSLHKLPHLCADIAVAARHEFKRVPADLAKFIRQVRKLGRGDHQVSDSTLLGKMKPYLTAADQTEYNQVLKLDKRFSQTEGNVLLAALLRLGRVLGGKPYP